MPTTKFYLLIKIFLLLICCFETATVEAKAEKIYIDGQVIVDDTQNFDFENLSVFAQYKRNGSNYWNILGNEMLDSKGSFNLTVPSNSVVSLEITTADPTIQKSGNSDDNSLFYIMESGKSITVLQKEFTVPVSSIDSMKENIILHRGAAFKFCFPPEVNSGAVFLNSLNTDFKVTNAWIFKESTPEVIFGGLKPESRKLTLVNEQNDQIKSEQFFLEKGEYKNLCRK